MILGEGWWLVYELIGTYLPHLICHNEPVEHLSCLETVYHALTVRGAIPYIIVVIIWVIRVQHKVSNSGVVVLWLAALYNLYDKRLF